MPLLPSMTLASLLQLLLLVHVFPFATSNSKFTTLPPNHRPSDAARIYLPSITALTFVANGVTNFHRSNQHAQLNCVGGDASHRTGLYPNRVQCFNTGLHSPPKPPRPKWYCITALPTGVKLSGWRVRCESWSSKHNLYVLRDSCWLDYALSYITDDMAVQIIEGNLRNKGGMDFAWFFRSLKNMAVAVVISYAFFFCLSSWKHLQYQQTLQPARETYVTIAESQPQI